mgnify:CR=1 FL=1
MVYILGSNLASGRSKLASWTLLEDIVCVVGLACVGSETINNRSLFGRECLGFQSWLRFETSRTAMEGAKRKELPRASANSTGQVTTTTTVTDGDSTNQTTTFCSCGIISHTKTETTVFATPDEEITMTTSTETIEGRTKICLTTKRRRRGEATTSSSSGSQRKAPPTGRSEPEPEVNERSDENRPSATRISRKGGTNYKKK